MKRDTDVAATIVSQRAKHDAAHSFDDVPRIVPPDMFLPRDRDDALRAIAELLYATIEYNASFDYVTCYISELREILDLIERS